MRACHRIAHKRQKRRAIWGFVFAGGYPGDRLSRKTPLAAAPAFRRRPVASRDAVVMLPSDEVRLARRTLAFTAIGAVATVLGLVISLAK